MKNICFFVGDISRSGGTERVTCKLANYLTLNGFDVSIISIYGTNSAFFPLDEKVKKYKLFDRYLKGTLSFPLIIFRLRKLLKKKRIHKLISVESMLALYSLPATFNLPIENICWEHFNFKINLGKKTRNIAMRMAAEYCSYVITLTDRDKAYWENNLKCKAIIKRIYNPIPFDNMYLPKFEKKKRIAIAVGRLTHQKGFDVLIKIWADLYHYNANWTLKIIGGGEEEHSLKTYCQNHDISNIEFISVTDNIQDYYSEASLYLMTSRYEGFPMVLLEAQEYGIPVLAFDCETGPSELILHNKTGWIINNNNVREFEERLIYALNLFEKDHDTYNKMCHEAFLNSKNYHIENIGSQWINILK